MKHQLKAFSITLCVLILGVMPALAQDEALGRAVTRDDWLSFMPVLIGSVIIVIIVDAIFIVPIFRKDNKKNEEVK